MRRTHAHATIHQLPSCGDGNSSRRTEALLWQDFFRDPSKWWDNRNVKPRTSRYPDFKHKFTGKPLWINSWNAPPWVHAALRSRGFLGDPCTQGTVSTAPIDMHATYDQLPSYAAVAKEDWNTACRHAFQWEEFFRDPSNWWDEREIKQSSSHPDFRHKGTKVGLWMDSRHAPSWVHAELRSRGFLDKPCFADASSAQLASFEVSLRACAREKDLVRGTSLHHALVQMRLLEKCLDAVVVMYASCGKLGKAKALLDMHRSKNVVSWTSLVAGYVREGQGQKALDCLEAMQHEGVLPDAVTYCNVLKACTAIRAIGRGKQIHEVILRQGLLQNNIILAGALVHMYAKCGAISQAQQVLEKLHSPNIVCWNALIAGWATEGKAEETLKCLEQMQHEGILPDALTLFLTRKAFAGIRAGDMRKRLHAKVASVLMYAQKHVP